MRIAKLCWIFVAIAALTTAASAADKAWDDCNYSTNDDRKIAECTRVLARAAKESKKNRAIALVKRGGAYRSKNDYDAAIRDYDEAIRLAPTSADAYQDRGFVYYLKREYDQAINDYDEAIRLDPNSEGAYRGRGSVYCEKKDYERAIKDYNDAIRLAPSDAYSYRLSYKSRAEAYEKKGDYERAIADRTELIRLEPNDAHSYGTRANVYERKGEHDRAIADYSEAIRLKSEDAYYYYSRGQVYIKAHDYDRAIVDFSEAIRVKPEDAYYISRRGDAYAEKGDYDRAIADYKEAFRLKPKDASYVTKIADLYLKNDDYDRAIADFDQFIRLNPKYIGAIAFRGQLYDKKGDYDHAIADYSEAIRIAGEVDRVDDMLQLYAIRLHLYTRKNDFDSAFADIERISRFGSKYEQARASINSILYALRAYVFGRMGQLDRAFAEIGEAFKHGENETGVDSVALLYRGELHLMKGDARAALADFDASLAKESFLPGVSRVYARAGRDGALKALAAPQLPAGPSATVAPTVTPPAALLAETRVALVIGNANYAAQSPLKNPLNDAGAISGALRGAGFRKVVIAENLSRDALVKSLQAFQEEADRADWAVIYFSGHGVEIGGVNYVVPTDARLLTDRNAPDEAVSLDRLKASVGSAHKLGIVILDACRDNPFVASMQRTIASRSAGKGLAPVEPTRGTLVVYAARDGQLAQDGAGENSPFAAALARRLAEPHVEVSKLFRLVTDDVLDATAHRQQPFVYGSLPGREDFYFRP